MQVLNEGCNLLFHLGLEFPSAHQVFSDTPISIKRSLVILGSGAQCKPFKKVHIVCSMKIQYFLLCCFAGVEDLHLVVQAIVEDQMVRKRQTMRFHGMAFLMMGYHEKSNTLNVYLV